VEEVVRRVSTEDPGRESKPQSFDLTHHETIAELRGLPDAKLERRHDVVEQAVTNTKDDQERLLYIERARLYRTELEQRQGVRQAERMEALTRSMNRLSWVVVLATIAGVGITVWALLSSG
jgi:hypothetical protein